MCGSMYGLGLSGRIFIKIYCIYMLAAGSPYDKTSAWLPQVNSWWHMMGDLCNLSIKIFKKKVCAKLQESQKEMKVSQLQLQSYAEDLVDLIQSNLQPLTAREKKDSLLSILSSVDPCQLDYISRTSNFSVRNIAYWVQKNWLQISVDRSSVTLSFIEFRM